MPRFPERLRVWFAFGALVAGGCDEKKDRVDLPDWSEGYETGGPFAGGGAGVPDGGAVVSQDGGEPVQPDRMTVAIPIDVTWPMRIRNRDNPSLPCEIPRDDPETELVWEPEKDIECIIDTDELDLAVLGLQFDVVVPEGMCEYLLRVPYLYENFEVGQGPSRVAYTVHEDGSYSDELNSQNGEAVCQYDYERLNSLLPNCCYGTYTREVTSAMSGETTTSVKSWGGDKLGECYYGAGYLDGFGRTAGGFPVPEVVYIAREAYVSDETFEGISEKYASNVALANFYDPDDHGGEAPPALRAEFANPHYEYLCLDHAEETIARIRIVVREWNEEAQFDVEGDPDTGGVETWPDMLPINDWTDWKDFGDAGESFPFLLPSE